MRAAGVEPPVALRAVAILVPLVACALFYLPTLTGGFLSDDYSVLGALYGWAHEQRLLAALTAKFGEGLDAPSHYYRPLAMLSFAANFALSGATALPWRVTNLFCHRARGALVCAIARAVVARPHSRLPLIAAMFAAAVFLLFPAYVEAVAWVSGRYDVMALAGMLASVACFQRMRRWSDGWGATALLTAVSALASKESAALLPAFVLAIAIGRHWPEGARRAFGSGVRDASPWLALGLGYFVLRTAIFGTPFRVYPDSSPLQVLLSGDWLKPLASSGAWLDAAMPLPLARTALLAALVVLIAMGAFASCHDTKVRGGWLAIALSAVLSIVLLLPHVAVLSSNGEQGRLFYTTSALLGLLVALPWCAPIAGPVPVVGRGLIAVATLMLIIAEAALLQPVVRRWADAGTQAKMLVSALARTSRAIPPTGYGLVLVPDHLGNVPFARNAQGGLVSPPSQPAPLSQRLIVQTPADLPSWPEHIERGLVDALQRFPLSEVWNVMAQRKSAGNRAPSHYFCWNADTRELVSMQWPAEIATRDWIAAWRGALAQSRCDASAAEIAEL